MLDRLQSTIIRAVGKLPLRVVLVAPLVLQLSGAIGLVGYLASQHKQRLLENQVQQWINTVDEQVVQKLESYLALPHQLNELNARAIQTGLLDPEDSANLQRQFWNQLQVFNSVSAIYVGNAQGGMLSVGHLRDGTYDLAISQGLQAGTIYRYALTDQGYRSELLDEFPVRDVRQRPWYTAAQAGQPTWSTIYANDADQELVITAVCPLYDAQGNLNRVIASDLLFSRMHLFLQQLYRDLAGEVYIMEPSGMLVSSSSHTSLLRSNGRERLAAVNSPDELIQESARHLLAQFGSFGTIQHAQRISFQIDNQRQFVQVAPLHDSYGLNWLVVMVVPESSFAQAINNNQQTSFLAGLVLLIVTAIGIWITYWITKPLLSLNAAAKQLARGNLAQRVEVDRTDAVGELAASFNQMAHQLQTSFAHMSMLNEVLSQSEHRLAHFLAALPIGVIVRHTDNTVAYCNQAICDIFGVAAGETGQPSIEQQLTNYPFYYLNSEHPYPTADLPMNRALQGERVSVEDIEIHRDGIAIPLEVHATPVFDAAGHVIYTILTFQDITARKLVERLQTEYHQLLRGQIEDQTVALRQSEAINRAIRDVMPDLLIRMRQDGVYLDVKPAKDFPVFSTATNLIGANVRDILPADAAQKRLAAAHHALKTGQTQIYEFQLFDGQRSLWQEARVVPIDVDEVLIVVRDLTLQKQAELALQQNERQTQAILQAIPDLMFRVSADGRYLGYIRTNQVIDLLPVGEDPIGRHISDFMPPEIAQRQLDSIQQALQTGKTQVYEQQMTIQGRIQYEEVRVVVSHPNEVLFIIRDITEQQAALRERKQTEAALRKSEAIQRQILKAIPDLLIWMDQEGTELERISGDRIRSILPDTEAVGQNTFSILPHELAERRIHFIRQALETGEVQIYEQEIVINGEIHYEEVRVVAVGRDRVLVIIRDISDRHQMELALQAMNHELQRLAALDGLTQVANRRHFDQYLQQEWRRLAREQQPLSLLLCDVDYFKAYNDHYGHQAGDDCLIQVASAMSQAMHRPADLVTRYGGEEFAIVLPNTERAGALIVAENIRHTVQELKIPHIHSQVSQFVTVSIGVACVIPLTDYPPEALVALSDEALYQAKHDGRNRITVSHSTLLLL